jgi:hypothetical protein
MRNGADPRSRCGTDMGIKWGTDIGIKCVILIASFLRFCVFDLFFCNGLTNNVVLTSYTAISIKESH